MEKHLLKNCSIISCQIPIKCMLQIKILILVLGLSLTLLELNEFHEISILELGSSKPGEIKALCEISDPTHGLITNIAPAHYMNFGSIQNIVNEKIELFNYLKDGTCFLNVSDKELSKVHIKR